MDRKPRLLVVDDTPENAQLLEAMLSPYGYSVALAFSGVEGLEKVRLGEPDVVLLDILMPDISGYEVCRRIRANPSTRLLPVVMLTSSCDQDKVESIEAGADDFIARPFDPRELLSRVRSLLRIKEYQDAVQAQAAQLAEWTQTLEQHFRGQLEQLEELDRLRRVFSPPIQPMFIRSDVSPVRIRVLHWRGSSSVRANTGQSSTTGESCIFGTERGYASSLDCSPTQDARSPRSSSSVSGSQRRAPSPVRLRQATLVNSSTMMRVEPTGCVSPNWGSRSMLQRPRAGQTKPVVWARRWTSSFVS